MPTTSASGALTARKAERGSMKKAVDPVADHRREAYSDGCRPLWSFREAGKAAGGGLVNSTMLCRFGFLRGKEPLWRKSAVNIDSWKKVAA
ncbi:MAG TPA: hypothetical protein VEC06_09890 [Paucimonas sp.]|nr:hypothetical protein [Paucimonas sp.]